MCAPHSELVHAAFDAWKRRDLEAVLALCEPDVEVRSLMTEAERATYRGHQGVRDWLAAVVDVFPDWRPEPLGVAESGTSAIAPFCVTGTGAASGAPIAQTYWFGARFSDAGRIAFFGFFRSEADALQAARPISSTR
ncbi:MAG TPA: nuclear transport factor 2 family protein [Thermoleophilaceae bacterium]|nr:nuclear transport factor 2 family protein [Thermoleophilaceae bacterium]